MDYTQTEPSYMIGFLMLCGGLGLAISLATIVIMHMCGVGVKRLLKLAPSTYDQDRNPRKKNQGTHQGTHERQDKYIGDVPI